MVDYIYVEIYDTLRTLKVTEVLDLVVRLLSLWFPFLRKALLKWDTNHNSRSNSNSNIKWAKGRTSKGDE